jgi:hypothetical protein
MKVPAGARSCRPRVSAPRVHGPLSSPNLAGSGRGTVESWRKRGCSVLTPTASHSSSAHGDHNGQAAVGSKSRAGLGHPPSHFDRSTWPQATAHNLAQTAPGSRPPSSWLGAGKQGRASYRRPYHHGYGHRGYGSARQGAARPSGMPGRHEGRTPRHGEWGPMIMGSATGRSPPHQHGAAGATGAWPL